ncbi:MAG: glycosyltransferase family 2 protein [Sarcina sp.]
MITVIMPLYNKGNYVEEAIESILNQSYEDFELIVVDDKSTDLSLKKASAFKDKRIKIYCNNQNLGVSATTNIAIRNSNGDIIVRMDADDVANKNRLFEIKKFFDKHEHIQVVGSNFEVFSDSEIPEGFYRFMDYTKNITSYEDIKENFTVMPIISQPTMAYRKKIFEGELLNYDSQYKTAEDYEQLGRMLCNKIKIEKIEKKLLRYRYINNSLSNGNTELGIKNSLEIKLKYILDFHKDEIEFKKNIYIWGTKKHASFLKEIIKKNKYFNILGYVDFNENILSEDKDGYNVFNPKSFIEKFNENDDLIITMWNIDRDKIIEFLNSRNLKRNKNYFVFS